MFLMTIRQALKKKPAREVSQDGHRRAGRMVGYDTPTEGVSLWCAMDLLGQRIAKLSDRIHAAHDITQSVQTFRLEEARCDRTEVSALANNGQRRLPKKFFGALK
jgi:hypothetical protein